MYVQDFIQDFGKTNLLKVGGDFNLTKPQKRLRKKFSWQKRRERGGVALGDDISPLGWREGGGSGTGRRYFTSRSEGGGGVALGDNTHL